MSSTTASSIRDLARSLGLSHTTVSQGLRNRPCVKLETRKRIQAAAQAAGYQSNVLTGVLMTGMRRRRGNAFSGMLAIIDIEGNSGSGGSLVQQRREMIEGASERAIELGFVPRCFAIGSEGLSRQTYDVILRSHDVCGVLILPAADPDAAVGFDWSRYAVAYMDHVIAQAPFHCVCSDPRGAMRAVLCGLREAGYRRPGLVLRESMEKHLLGQWADAYRDCLNGDAGAPVLLAPKTKGRSFSNWFAQHNPDVVLSCDVAVMEWMRACGAKIPESHGFFCINKASDADCAGFDGQPRLVGARGIEQVIAQLLRYEFGRPSFPLSTIVPGLWVDGPTIRK